MSNSIDVLVLTMIMEDMENDVKEFEGRPFNGKTLGELHGNLCAALQAVARILKDHIQEDHDNADTTTA